MTEKSAKHGPRLDDEMRHETEGLVRGRGPSHAEPWKDPEPVETDTGRDPTATFTDRKSAPIGMTPRDVERRSSMAKVLVGLAYPADHDSLVEHATSQGAPDVIVQALDRLPSGPYERPAEIFEALGIAHETRRT